MTVALINLINLPINLQWFFVNAYILKFWLKGLHYAHATTKIFSREFITSFQKIMTSVQVVGIRMERLIYVNLN